MEISEYKNIYTHEQKHFFYVSTHDLVLRLIRKNLPMKSLSILDAGCGTGGLVRKLSKFGTVTGVDYGHEAIKFARRRGVTAKKASILKMPFKAKSFDLVTCIDVIYHKAVKSDIGALREIRRVLKSDGVLILRAPANKFLFSAHDRHVHTARRYSKAELGNKLKRSGFRINQISYVHSIIFPISLGRVWLEKINNKTDSSTIGVVNPLLNTVIIGLLRIEAWLIANGVTIPYGQGLIAVAYPTK